MKIYYVAQVKVFVDGQESSIETVNGSNFDLDIVKESAEKRVRAQNKGKRITSVLISNKEMDLEEYKKATGGTPLWLGGDR